MKATGIVRRIDDLGRIVIPKENATHEYIYHNNVIIHSSDANIKNTIK